MDSVIINEVHLPHMSSMKVWAVTGTFHGSIIYARTEGEARRAFHDVYNGESILACYITLTR